MAIFRVFHDLALGDDVVASITREPVDAVIVDCMLLGVLARAQSAGVPTFVIAHTVMSYWHSWRRNPLTVLMSARGGFRAEQLWNAASRVLVTALPELDSASHHDTRFAWTGPVVPREAASSAGDAVLVSLSGINLPGQLAVMQRAIDAVAHLGLPLIVTTGPAIDPQNLRVPRDAQVHVYMPHAEAMRHARLVIGHGGHGTTMTALAHDLPVVALPLHPMIDQPIVAAAVERAGAGIALSKRARPATIAAAVQRALDDPAYRAAAARLGATIRDRNAASTAVDEMTQALSRTAS